MDYTLEQMQQALMSAHAAGDTQSAQMLADAIRNMEQETAQPPEESPQSQIEQDRANVGQGMNLQIGIPGVTPIFDTGWQMPQGLTEALAGAGRRFTDIASLGTAERSKEADRLLNDSGYAAAGGAVADLATLAAGGGALAAAKTAGAAVPTVLSALTTPTTALQATLGGAAYGGLTDPDRVGGVLGGGLGGGLGHGVVSALGKVARPNIQAGAQGLIDQGATLTPGEIVGGSVQTAEDAATSLPIVGDMIRSAKRGSIEDYNKIMIDDALSPIGEGLEGGLKAGREAISQAHKKISDEYDEILSGMNVYRDSKLVADLDNIKNMATEGMRKKEAKIVRNEIDKYLLEPFDNPNAMLLGETFKETDSALRNRYKGFLKQDNPLKKDVGQALRAAHKALLEAGKRQHPNKGQRLDLADKAYAKMSRIDEASSFLGAQQGLFTPAQMLNRVKGNTSTRQFAEGSGFGQQMAEDSKDVLAQSLPDSGTTARMFSNIALLGGGAAIEPMSLGVVGAASLPYTGPGKRVLQTMLTTRPNWAGAARRFLDEGAGYAGDIGRIYGINEE